jgi:hypothetical protein
MKWTLRARRLWYKLTGEPVWLHTKCVNKLATTTSDITNNFHKRFWVIGYHCPHCNIDVEAEDYYCNRPAGEWTLSKLNPAYKMFSRFEVNDR